MNFDEMNKYIFNYLTNDKTNSAIMINGKWGTGKSFYIKNSLEKYIKENLKDGDYYDIVVVSLYGMSELKEISKSIYMERRMLKLKKNETFAYAAFTGKAVINGISNFLNINPNIKEKDLNIIYESVNLCNTLVVLDDVERSRIEIDDILGYVNNLTENENVKILLVVNENELIKRVIGKNSDKIAKVDNLFEKSGSCDNDKQEKTLTFENEKYLKYKEKTISETLILDNNYKEAIKSIIDKFSNFHLRKYTDIKYIEKTIDLVKNDGSINLRSFLIACQTIENIYNIIDGTNDNKKKQEDKETFCTDFYDCIYFSCLRYIFEGKKKGKYDEWNSDMAISKKLGCENNPLPLFCYEYVNYQRIQETTINKSYEDYLKIRAMDAEFSENDEDFIRLRQYYIISENEVRNSVINLSRKLTDDKIPISLYCEMIFYLIIVSNLINYNLNSIKEKMIDNVKKHIESIKIEYLDFFYLPEYQKPENVKEYELFVEELRKVIKERRDNSIEYSPKSVDLWKEKIEKNNWDYYDEHSFMNRFDIDKLANMFFECTPEQMDKYRRIFLYVYASSNIKDYLGNDCKKINDLKSKVEEIKKQNNSLDKIQLLQLDWFIENLEKISNKLQ